MNNPVSLFAASPVQHDLKLVASLLDAESETQNTFVLSFTDRCNEQVFRKALAVAISKIQDPHTISASGVDVSFSADGRSCSISFQIAILDERSRLAFLLDLSGLYAQMVAGKQVDSASLPELKPIESRLDSDKSRSFWVKRLEGSQSTRLWKKASLLPAVSNSFFDLPLKAGVVQALRDRANELSVSVESLAEYAFALLLSRVSGSDLVRFGLRKAEPSFVDRSTSPLGNYDLFRAAVHKIDGALTVSAAIETAHRLGEEDDLMGWVALSELARLVNDGSSNARIADILLDIDLSIEAAARRDELRRVYGAGAVSAAEVTGFPLGIALRDQANAVLAVSFDEEFLSPGQAQGLAAAYATVLAELSEGTDALVSEISLSKAPALGEDVFRDFVESAPEWQGGLARALAAHAHSIPHSLAVQCGEDSLTFAELNEQAALVAGMLLGAGLERGEIVGVYLERGVSMVPAILGVLRAGAVWLPLDPAYPKARSADVLERSGARIILTQRALAGNFAEVDGVKEVLLEDSPASHAMAEPFAMVPEEPAYLIYTSGSTGKPKGVLISHGNVTHYARSLSSVIELSGSDRWLHTASLAFSSSVRQLFVPLLNGASVVVARRAELADPRELLALVGRSRATVMDLVPSYWARLVEVIESESDLAFSMSGLRMALSASEPLPWSVLQRWFKVSPGESRFVNMYGQTETTGIAIAGEVSRKSLVNGSIVPLGKPLPGMCALVLDAAGQPVPDGLDGEIHVWGTGVGLGYHGAPELTEERFKNSSLSLGGALYATGDRGFVDAESRLTFSGRSDNQVKIRGHRVEIEEVEAVLRSHSAVQGSAVDARNDVSGDVMLVAFVTLSADSIVTPTSRELKEFLAASLPDYMVPSVVQVESVLPHTPNGKLDRNAIAQLKVDLSTSTSSYIAPRYELESELADMWSEVLGIPKVGVTDHFFEIGGHSLMAIRVLARIRSVYGVDLPVRTLFEKPTVASLASLVAERRGNSRNGPELKALPPGTPIPLSFAQERLWVLNQIEPESAAYNLVAAFRIHGSLDMEALRQALTAIETRHEALRTVFPSEDGVARVLVRSTRDFPLPVETIAASLPGDGRDSLLVSRAAELAAVPFDLAEGPLFKGSLLQADEKDHMLVLVMHHVISDGWSRGVLYRELGELYDSFVSGRAAALPEISVQYGDFAAWQRAWLTDEVSASQSEWWKKQMAGPLPVLDLPTDRPRPPVQTFSGATHTFHLGKELAERLRELGAQEDATSFMVLLAGFQALLARYSGQDDIVVGSPTAGRTTAETEPLIGFFVNTLALRNDLSGNPDFRTLLARTRRMALDAFEHQDLPFERLVEALHLPRDLSRSPLFQVLFILQNTPVYPLQLPGLVLEQVNIDAGAAKFDITLSLIASDEGYTGQLEYNTDLFDAATIERFADHYVNLLESGSRNPDAPAGKLQILTASERSRLLHDWNSTVTHLRHGDTIVSQFERQVVSTPEAKAATFESETLNYSQLNERANKLARHLTTLGAGPDGLVGIYMERSLEMVVAMLAVLKAGAAYLPLDPSYPAERITYMLEDSGAGIVLTQGRLTGKLSAGSAHVLRVDTDLSDFSSLSDRNPAPVATDSNLAYQIYTSGSTGKPKGVMIEHRNAVNFFAGMDERIGGDKPGTWLAVTSISFDISVLELLWTLTRGYHVVVQADPERVRSQQSVKRSDRKLGFSLFYFASDAQASPDSKYKLLMEGARFADTHGFEAVWTPERHFHAFGGLYPSPAVVSAAIAATTKNVKIRSGSVVLPLHSPVRVAEDWSVVDNISGGRVGLGFASGWHDRDFVFAPDNYANRRDVLVEYMDTVARLWRGEQVTLPGGSGKPATISILPRPIQPELPMWVTAAGTPQTYETAGKKGANVLTHLLGQTPETLREKIALYRAARKHAGHEGPGHITLMMHTYVHEDMEHVKRTVWHPFREYLRTSVDLIKGLAEGRGQDMRSSEFTAEDMEALLDHAFHRYFDTSALMGTPESCFEMVEQLKSMDVDEVACLIDFGIPEDQTMAGLELLGELRRRSDESSASALADFDIASQMERWNVTHFQCTPSMAAMLLQEPEARPSLAGLECMMVGGEAFPTSLASELRSLVKGRVVNMYGPTETTIWSTTHEIGPDDVAIPLGTPISNTVCHVVDRNMELVPVGVPGELLIGGAGVVRGYHARQELTAERFIPDTISNDDRLYRTGDLVRWNALGKLEFLGRLDHQVKVRGHRIELGEIEAILESREDIREAVVIVRAFSADDNRLVAYVVPARGRTVEGAGLRQFAGERLPDYMVPSHVVVMDALPRTPNLKVDRKALPAPNELAPQTSTYVQPAGELEGTIASIWQDVLQVSQVGVNDNFFDIGGHSLLTVKVHVRLRSAIDRPVSITDLFRFPTVRSLAEHLGGAVQDISTGDVAQARADARREAMQQRRTRRGPNR